MPVRARFVVYPSGFPPGSIRPNPPELHPVTIERHIGGRCYSAQVSPNGTLSLREVAAFLDVDPATVWRWVRAKKLVALKERGRLKVAVRELYRFERKEHGPWLRGESRRAPRAVLERRTAL